MRQRDVVLEAAIDAEQKQVEALGETLARQAMELFDQMLPKDHPRAAWWLCGMGNAICIQLLMTATERMPGDPTTNLTRALLEHLQALGRVGGGAVQVQVDSVEVAGAPKGRPN